MPQFDLINRIKLNNKYSSIDYYYGPYISKEEAYTKVPYEIRQKGLKVGIIEEDSIVDYWWKKGIEDIDLEKYIDGNTLYIGYGEKRTGIDSGKEFEISITDDYMYICVTPGESDTAIWKKIILYET